MIPARPRRLSPLREYERAQAQHAAARRQLGDALERGASISTRARLIDNVIVWAEAERKATKRLALSALAFAGIAAAATVGIYGLAVLIITALAPFTEQ